MQVRISSYLALINFLMVLYLYVIKDPMGLPWYSWILIITSVICLVMFLDNRLLLASETYYLNSKNPQINEILTRLDNVEENMRCLNGSYAGEAND